MTQARHLATVHHRTATVEGLEIFYREAGPPAAPTAVLLHGFPSSSRMYAPLFTRLAGRYRLIAPDYPGFGHSDAPAAGSFHYTFDHLARIIERFTELVGLSRYSHPADHISKDRAAMQQPPRARTKPQ